MNSPHETERQNPATAWASNEPNVPQRSGEPEGKAYARGRVSLCDG